MTKTTRDNETHLDVMVDLNKGKTHFLKEVYKFL